MTSPLAVDEVIAKSVQAVNTNNPANTSHC